MIKSIRKSKKAYRLVVFMLLVSMIMTGCTNLIGGTTPEHEIDYGTLEAGSGMLDENGQLKESTRTGVNARLNYLAGGDYGSEKYSATYKDAFFVAEDLSNDVMDVAYFKLLDTYDNANGNTTFVYVYQTKQYADGGRRTGELVHVQETGDYVLYPDVYTEEELPVSDTYVTVLATYAYDEGESSYHEIGRFQGDAISSMLAKPVFTSENNDLNNPQLKYYSILSQEKIYIYNADAVKSYSNKGTAKSEISSGYGNMTESGWVDTSFGSVLSSGFEKMFDIQVEFDAFKQNDEKLKYGSYDIDVYDYSVYTRNEDYYITLDVSATKQGYTGPDIEVEVVDENGNPISSDDQDDTVEDDIEEGAAFDFVGTICHVKLPEGLEFQELYSPTKTETTLGLAGIEVARQFNYQLVPVDSVYYADKASNTIYGTSDWFSPYFGFYSYVVKDDGGGALEIGRDGFFSFTKVYDNVTLRSFFADIYVIANQIDETDEAAFKEEILKRKVDSSTYEYKDETYKLVTNPDAYWAFYNSYGSDKYTVNLNGDFEVVGDYDSLYQDFKDTQLGYYWYYYNGEGTGIDYHGKHYAVYGGAINGLKFKLYNGSLDASAFSAAEAGVVEPYYLCDDLAIFKGALDNGTTEPEQYLTPYVIPLTQISNIMTDYSWISEKLIKIAIDSDAGEFHGIDTMVCNGKLYVLYIYDKKVILCQPDNTGLPGLASDTDTIGIDRVDCVINNLNERGIKYNTDRARTYGNIIDYYNEISWGGFECYVLNVDNFVPGSLGNASDAYQFTGNTAEDNFKTDYTASVSANIDADEVTASAANDGTAGGTGQVYYESSADGLTRKYISIVFGYENEGVSFYDNAGNPIAEDVSYSDIVDVINGTKTIGSITGSNITIINNWDVSQANTDSATYKSIKDEVLANLHYRYSTFVIDNGDGTYKVEIKQVENTGDITLYTYDGITDAASLISKDHKSGTVAIDDYTWASINNYVSAKLKPKSSSSSSANIDLSDNVVDYDASNLGFITGTFDNDAVEENYIVSTTAGNGLGFYDIASGQYFIPTFQRHEIRNVTTTTKTIDNTTVTEYDLTNTTDEIVALENVAAYGIYENKGDNADVYPYYFMGYDRKGMTYTNIEMIKAKMVPFGIAYGSTDGNGNTAYYRDFTPVAGNNMVYYLPTAYYNQYGILIIDNTFDGGEGSKTDGDDSDDTEGDGEGGDNPNPGGGDGDNPNPGGGGGDTPSPGPGGGGGDNPNPGGGGGDTPSPGPGGGDGGNPNPGGGGDGGNPNPGGDGTGGGNGGFTGEVFSDQARITSLYDGDGDGDDSLSDNSISDNSASGNSASDNSAGGRPAVSDNGMGGDGTGGSNWLKDLLGSWLFWLIILLILIVAYIINRKRRGLPILPFLPVKRRKEENENSETPGEDTSSGTSDSAPKDRDKYVTYDTSGSYSDSSEGDGYVSSDDTPDGVDPWTGFSDDDDE